MDRLIERCAGLDVHKKTVAACVRTPGQDGQRQQQSRTFATTTKGLVALRDWLAAAGVTVVGMESTGAYWKAVYYLLEDTVAYWLLNARHLRNVPGRKTDVADAAWICQLVEHRTLKVSPSTTSGSPTPSRSCRSPASAPSASHTPAPGVGGGRP
jgi:transposase